ncbi:Glutathione import ATP-binding protein GsiA, partial [Geodia barretti]
IPVEPLLQVKNLQTYFFTYEGVVKAVDDVTYEVMPGETLGLVGESGCGKSVSALSLMRLIPDPPGKTVGGEVLFDGEDILQVDMDDMRRIRGAKMAMVFQEPMTSLNPVLTLDRQLTETIQLHMGKSRDEARRDAIELLARVGISDPDQRIRQYPHQFSGGMRQRVMIAMALSCNPRLIIADEPTTALDVTIQAQILELMKSLTLDLGVALIIITHNLGVVARYADRVNVMYAGKIIERGSALEIYTNPRHPYTVGLLDSMPQAASTPTGQDDTLLEVRGLKMYFPVTSGILFQRAVAYIKAVDDISFTVRRGETLGLVGESGCGKTTTGRCILRLYKPTEGEILFDGVDVAQARTGQMRAMRRQMQIIFQDPYSSLNPRMTAGNIIGEPLAVHGLVNNKREYRERVAELLTNVGLNPYMADRFPHEFSGGQRQRIGVARALSVDPAFIVCDEPVSALDVSIQAQIINLLEDLQERYNLTYLFIAHDLSVVRHISDRVAVMYLGKLVEIADRNAIYENPQHPYTRALLSAVPIPDPVLDAQRERIILTGEVPSPLNPPSGCVFHPRCPMVTEDCSRVLPETREILPDHVAACINVPGYGPY